MSTSGLEFLTVPPSSCLHLSFLTVRVDSESAFCDSGVCVSDSMMLIICPQAARGRGEAEMWTEMEMDRKRA